MPAAELFHAAFMRARAEGLIEDDFLAGASAGAEGDVVGALSTGFVLPPADFEKSGRPISRPYWDAVRKFPFHWPLDLPIGDGSNFEWEDDPMPRFASYELMIQKDDTFAWWAKQAQTRFANLSMLIRMMRQSRRNDDENIRQWADHEYTEIIGSTEAEVPDRNLARLLGGDYSILIDDERLRIWWNWAECHWAIAGFLSQRHGYHTAADPFDDDLIATWLFLLVGRHVIDEWSQPAWLRSRLFDWRQLPLFAVPVPAARLLVPKGALPLHGPATLKQE
ncbi:hypothetical protein [Sphingomonas sp. TDK1]|uniref:hypothetical protein n=1 Tax=Sphingomonas sp. TDK1 TaxID=453247 RepID=UPI0007D99960|nr:hypothetical protein [Sphingomonas sp. TDK1]OAN57228.1 hypothetical protein A7X12_08415 [Sphingomonas sp. TDK1]